jgi:thiamine pyrophosphokinase
MSKNTIILADGSFPVHEIPLSYLRDDHFIVCCDGSVENLVAAGFEPDAIVGDMDSISPVLRNRFADRIFVDENQDTNDLTKAVEWCRGKNFNDIVILGGTGKREDHTLGNISLLADYVSFMNVIMVTDTGVIRPLLKGSPIPSFTGQQVSVFSIDTDTEVTTYGLKYPLNRTKIKNWWCATLNESLGDRFSIEFTTGRVLLYLKFA